jgi:Tol biopolymer transport system component
VWRWTYRKEKSMRSTRIRLATLAALAALAALRRRKVLFILAAAGLLSVAGCSNGGNTAKNDSLEASESVSERVGGWIAFRNGTEIVAVDPSSSEGARTTVSSFWFADPIAWSSDGSKLLLRSREGVAPRLFVLHADGSRTSFGTLSDGWGSFSPDGTEIAYATDYDHQAQAYIVGADGGRPRPLGRRCPRKEISLEVCDDPAAAAWSPDGLRIAWCDLVLDSAAYGHQASVLFFVNPYGTGREEVAPLPRCGYSLVWSPDGSRLAFWTTEDNDLDRPGQIFVINADGSGLRQVTREGDNRWPAWSPDGSRIAYVHNGTLSTLAADGTDMQTLNGVTPDGAIAWNPAG